MFQHQGIWLPDGEKHFPDWMTKNGEIIDGKGTYQIKKLRAALEHCKDFRVAVDVGAHVGLWSMRLIKSFHTVHAFEPVAAFRQCWAENMPGNFVGVGGPIAMMYPIALGAEPGHARMAVNPADTGGTHVGTLVNDTALSRDFEPLKDHVAVKTLDEHDFADVDFLKIDCEGFEHHVIAGARETLLRCKPCVIVEQKAHKLGPNFGIKGTPAVDMLRELGAEVRREISGDYVMAWR